MSSENWYSVDNVAKVFLATYNRRDTRSLRVSCTMKEEIDPAVLDAALKLTIEARPQFQVRIRRGLFWHYIESTEQMPIVAEESDRPCPILYGPDYKGVLHYQVTYFKRRINFEIFHALSDGTGALDFLNVLVLNYLKLLHPEEFENEMIKNSSSEDERERDSYEQFYDKHGANATDHIPVPRHSYQLQGKYLPYNQLQFFEITMPAKDVVANAKNNKVTVTSYIAALLMLAIKSDMPLRQKSKPISISFPVNLRNFYESETSRNFFNSIVISHTFDKNATIAELSAKIDRQMKLELAPDRIHEQMTGYSRMQHIIFARMVPLAIKQLVIRFFTKMQAKSVTAVVSNLGVLRLPQKMQEYVDSYSAYCSHNGMFMTISSYGEKMKLCVSMAVSNRTVLRHLIKQLRAENIDVTVDATEIIR